MSQSTLAITPGTGAIAAVDSVSSVLYQQIKLIDGTIGSTTGIPGTGDGLFIQGSVASTATDSGNPVKIGGIYTSTTPTLATGQRVDLQMDSSGNSKTREQYSPVAENNVSGVIGMIFKPVNDSTYAPLTYKNAGSVTKANVKSSVGNIYSIRITNANSAIRYFQLHNKATAPAAADTAQQYFLIPGGTATQPAVVELGIEWFAPSEYFTTGIGWAISTTATTFTDSATSTDHFIIVRYA